MSRTLSNVALPHLQQLLRLVQTGDMATPLTATALQARGLGHCWPELAWLAPLDRAGRVVVISPSRRPKAIPPE